MTKGIILYQSKYGATEKYVNWLKQATGYACQLTKQAKMKEILEYDILILAGGVYAGSIAGISFLKKNWQQLKRKKLRY